MINLKHPMLKIATLLIITVTIIKISSSQTSAETILPPQIIPSYYSATEKYRYGCSGPSQSTPTTQTQTSFIDKMLAAVGLAVNTGPTGSTCTVNPTSETFQKMWKEDGGGTGSKLTTYSSAWIKRYGITSCLETVIWPIEGWPPTKSGAGTILCSGPKAGSPSQFDAPPFELVSGFEKVDLKWNWNTDNGKYTTQRTLAIDTKVKLLVNGSVGKTYRIVITVSGNNMWTPSSGEGITVGSLIVSDFTINGQSPTNGQWVYTLAGGSTKDITPILKYGGSYDYSISIVSVEEK